jgi:hypothetical protein
MVTSEANAFTGHDILPIEEVRTQHLVATYTPNSTVSCGV